MFAFVDRMRKKNVIKQGLCYRGTNSDFLEATYDDRNMWYSNEYGIKVHDLHCDKEIMATFDIKEAVSHSLKCVDYHDSKPVLMFIDYKKSLVGKGKSFSEENMLKQNSPIFYQFLLKKHCELIELDLGGMLFEDIVKGRDGYQGDLIKKVLLLNKQQIWSVKETMLSL